MSVSGIIDQIASSPVTETDSEMPRLTNVTGPLVGRAGSYTRNITRIGKASYVRREKYSRVFPCLPSGLQYKALDPSAARMCGTYQIQLDSGSSSPSSPGPSR